jgi:aspartate aminotransferase
MKPISHIASAVHASTTLAIDSLAKKMKSKGLDIIGFGAGEPDFDTPQNIKDAGIAAIVEGQTKYTGASGMDSLKQAVADRLEKDCNVKYDPSQIVMASGAKHNVYIALQALLNPGDEVILPAPYWVTYEEVVKMAGATPVVIHTTEESGFKMSAEQLQSAITDKTKVLVLNNPSNPTGMIYSKAQLQEIADVCVKNDLYVISDEIYYHLVYEGKEFVSFASLGSEIKERTILINGVSKSYAMTGWRIGYSASNAQLAKVMSNYLSHSTSAPSTISQFAALEALNGPQDSVFKMRDEFEKRRNYIFDRINAMDGVRCIKPEGAFYVMLNVSDLIGKKLGGTLIKDGDDFAMSFLEKGLVAAVPCSGFGAPNFVRFTYATSMENIKEGMDRLEKFLKN